jgi:hypothetical protein
MRPHKQLFRHKPEEGVYGDCQRTVFACLLDRDSPEDVPHFGQPDEGQDEVPEGQFWDRANAWLGQQGYKLFQVAYPGNTPLHAVLRTQGMINPGIWYMLAGKSANGCQHVVICLGDAIAWDTSIDQSGIVAPGEDGLWRIEVLVPLNQTTLHREGGIEMLAPPLQTAPKAMGHD